jgi:hypothetical protein
MRAGLITILVVAATLLVGGAPGGAAATRNTRAMWLWTTADPASVVEWATAHGVHEILAHVPPRPDLAWARDLRARSAAAGIKLSALGGDPAWVRDHAAALAWLRTVDGTGLFDAVHVDVEPHALPAWRSDQVGTAKAYLSLLAKLAAATALPLEADVAFWYGQIVWSKRTNLATEILARVDAVTVMSYRDTATGPNSILDVGADFLRRGAAAGRPVRLGAETMRLADCAYCTFAEVGTASLDAALTAVDAAGAGFPAYAGIAVHHYDSWRALELA